MATEIQLERTPSEMGFKTGRADIMKALQKKPPAQDSFADEVYNTYLSSQHFGFYTSWLDFAQINKIYTGQYSEVFIAKCRFSRGKVVLKSYILSKMGSAQQKILKSRLGLMQEIMAPDKFENSSSDIVRCFGFFEEQGQIVFIMEYCARRDLMNYIKGRSVDEANVVIELVQPLLRCLQHLHAAGITHGNMTPDNILLTADGYVKVADFDSTTKIGKRTQRSSQLSPRAFTSSDKLATDQKSSTSRIQAPNLEFMAPELVEFHFPTASISETGPTKRMINPYEPPCDIWALGVTVYELLTGRLPFSQADGKDSREMAFLTARSILQDDVTFPINLRISEEATSFINDAMQKNKAMRPTAESLMNHPWIQKYAQVEVATLFVDEAPTFKQIGQESMGGHETMTVLKRVASKMKLGLKKLGLQQQKDAASQRPSQIKTDNPKPGESGTPDAETEDSTIKAANAPSLPVRRRTLGGNSMPQHMDALLGFTAPEDLSDSDEEDVS